MKKPFSISSKEFGRGPAHVDKFATLTEVQTFVKSHWQGPEYIDDPRTFHSDYCRFYLKGCELADLGDRGTPGTDEWWDWTWKVL